MNHVIISNVNPYTTIDNVLSVTASFGKIEKISRSRRRIIIKYHKVSDAVMCNKVLHKYQHLLRRRLNSKCSITRPNFSQ